MSNKSLLKELSDKIESANKESAVEEKPVVQRRPARRTPVGGPRNVLRMNKVDPDHVYRIVNDVGDRVEEMKEQGYVVVDDPSVRVGDRRAGKAGQVGAAVTVHVGQGQKGVLMKQRKDWYDEDQAQKNSQVDEIEETMYKRARKEESDYGTFKIDKG